MYLLSAESSIYKSSFIVRTSITRFTLFPFNNNFKAMACLTVTDLLKRNKTHATDHSPLPTVPEMPDAGVSFPKVIIVSCTDPRVIPENIFQLSPGEAFVMRDVAGHPQTVLKDIVTLDAFLGITDIIVMHHTDCGSTYFTNDLIRSELKKTFPENNSIDTMDFGAVSTSIEQNVKDDIKFLQDSPLIRTELGARVHGMLYDIKTGEVKEIGA